MENFQPNSTISTQTSNEIPKDCTLASFFPKEENNNCTLVKTSLESANAKRKKAAPVRSICPKRTRMGCGPPGTLFKLTLTGTVAVTRDYSEYFNYKTLLFETFRGRPALMMNCHHHSGYVNSAASGNSRPKREQSSTASGNSSSKSQRRNEVTNGIGSANNHQMENSSNAFNHQNASNNTNNHQFHVQSSTSSTSFNGNNTSTTQSKTTNGGRAVLLSARRMSANGASCSRSCTSCGASKTPYWRDGWGSEVVLCNACGLRYQKFKKFCLACKYIPRKEEQQSEQCSQCCHSWR